MAEQTLRQKTTKGLFWGGLSNGLQQLLNLILGIFLGRLLSPHDYGMVGMLTIFMVLAGSIQECGFTNALTNRKEASQRDYNAVFWFSTLMGIMLYTILFFCAPLIPLIYQKPELHDELVPLARFLFLGFVISSTTVVPNAILFKALRVKEKMMAQMTALILSGSLGLLLALNGYVYWSLAALNVTSIAVYAIMMWHFSRWRPSLSLDFAPIREMIGFSSKILVTNVVQQVNNNVFSFLLGRWFTTSVVGAYAQANKWNNMGFSLISNMIAGVAQPVFTSVGDDTARQRNIFRKLLRFTSFMAFPMMIGLGLIAHELIVITVGEKWLPSVPILRILCFWGAFAPVATLFTNLIISKGASGIYMYSTIALGALQILALYFVHPYGLTSMLVVFVLIYLLWQLVWQYWAWRLIGLPPATVWRDMLPFAAVTALAIGIAYWLTHSMDNIYLSIVAKILIAAAVYAATMKLLGAKIFDECIRFILRKKVA